MVKNVPPGSVIESSGTCPHWEKLPNFDMTELRLPHVPGRAELFRKVFPEWVQPLVGEKEGSPDQALFTAAALQKRSPNYIAVYSLDYKVPSERVRKYYDDLLTGRFPYAIVFDAETQPSPRWIYPRTIDMLRGRITILQRRS
jgi:hypothetical protein